jgi:hypothetical protein
LEKNLKFKNRDFKVERSLELRNQQIKSYLQKEIKKELKEGLEKPFNQKI